MSLLFQGFSVSGEWSRRLNDFALYWILTQTRVLNCATGSDETFIDFFLCVSCRDFYLRPFGRFSSRRYYEWEREPTWYKRRWRQVLHNGDIIVKVEKNLSYSKQKGKTDRHVFCLLSWRFVMQSEENLKLIVPWLTWLCLNTFEVMCIFKATN